MKLTLWFRHLFLQAAVKLFDIRFFHEERLTSGGIEAKRRDRRI